MGEARRQGEKEKKKNVNRIVPPPAGKHHNAPKKAKCGTRLRPPAQSPTKKKTRKTKERKENSRKSEEKQMRCANPALPESAEEGQAEEERLFNISLEICRS